MFLTQKRPGNYSQALFDFFKEENKSEFKELVSNVNFMRVIDSSFSAYPISKRLIELEQQLQTV